MKSLFTILFALASLLAAQAGDFAFVYRGRVDLTGRTGDVDVAVRVSAYSEAIGGAAVWTKDAVAKIDSKGLFQLEFVDDGLAEAFRAGTARWLGVKLADGSEQYPRQQILDAPIVERAERAKRLAPDAQVSALEADTVQATAASLAGGTEIRGALVSASGADTLSVSSVSSASGRVKFAKADGSTVSVFRSAAPTAQTFSNGFAKGDVLVSGTRGGVVTIITDSNWTAPCVSFFAPPGDVRAPFAAGGSVRVYFYPLGTAN